MEGEPSSFQSICHVRASEVFPKPVLTYEEVGLKIPFSPTYGEAVEALGRITGGVIALSNFRLFIVLDTNTIHNIPLGAIESIDNRELPFLYVLCKDGRSVKFSFTSAERCQEWLRRLGPVTGPIKQVEVHFAFAYHAWIIDECDHVLLQRLTLTEKTFHDEVKRMKFSLEPVGPWRISQANAEYQLCPSYPRQLLVPASVSDNTLEAIANFRVSRRLPVVVWRHPKNGAVIARSSQPEVGLLWWRSKEDEEFICAIRKACAVDSPSLKGEDSCLRVLIMDARSFPTAVLNRARGGGVECIEYYPHCDIQFMNLANIHAIRRSFQLVRSLCATPDNGSWCSGLDNTKWLNNLSGLLGAAVIACDALDREARPVLVHCSDGWDRTPQIVSLAQILLDPYYRTLEGFQALIQREWLDFGHKFGDRCGNSVGNDDSNDRSPVFLQWLDCVHQLLLQFPCSFQYSEQMLVRLVHHTYSNLYGTFLGNSPKERSQMRISERTFSVWPLFKDEKYRNLLYQRTDEVLRPSSEVRDLTLWMQVFMAQPSANLNKSSLPTLSSVITAASPSLSSEMENRAKENGFVKSRVENETEGVVTNGNSSPNGEDKTDGSQLPASMRLLHRTRKNRTISEELYENYVGLIEQPSEIDFKEGEIQQTVAEESGIPVVAAPMQDANKASFAEGNCVGENCENTPSEIDFKEGESQQTVPAESEIPVVAVPMQDVNKASFPEGNCVAENCENIALVHLVMDLDGLMTTEDPVQVRLRSIIDGFKARELALQRDLRTARLDVLKHRYGLDDEVNRPDSTTGSASLPSDLSWEAVEERDLQSTLWVPDHAVSKCKGCSSQFWIGRRKHHCRKCGNIFCSDCSEHTALIPGEDLYYPARVCNSCHDELQPEHNPANGNGHIL